VSFLLFAQADEVTAVTTVLVASAVSLISAAPVAARRGGFSVPSEVRRYVAGSAVLEVIAFIAAVAALARGPASVASVLLAQFATVVLLLGIVVLRERPAPHQLVGVGLAIVATSVFAVST